MKELIKWIRHILNIVNLFNLIEKTGKLHIVWGRGTESKYMLDFLKFPKTYSYLKT